jgi:hypothetical protein
MRCLKHRAKDERYSTHYLAELKNAITKKAGMQLMMSESLLLI